MTKKGAHRPGVGIAARTLPARFWSKVDKTDPSGCWIWTGAKSCGGHGVIWTGGQPYQKPAHHVSLQFVGIEVPVGMFVDHICRNRACVNPDHLRVVTPTINAIENNDSPLAVNRRKTHCKYGHPLSGNNVRIVKGKGPKGSPTTGRICLKCYGPGGIRRGKRAPHSSGTSQEPKR